MNWQIPMKIEGLPGVFFLKACYSGISWYSVDFHEDTGGAGNQVLLRGANRLLEARN